MHSFLAASTFGLLFAAEALAAIGPDTNLLIGNKVISPDGFSRSAVLAGSDASSLSFPGPLITGNKGDTFHLNVIDALTDTTMLTSTSIHWHGFFQKASSWADGPVGVTQCPIPSGQSFQYVFSTADQAGTYWYHSHHSTQYCDGLRGPMVVYDPNDPQKSLYDVDDDTTVITLADWYHVVALGQTLPTPAGTLINGLGRFAGGQATELAVIQVEQNKRYRFRLVSISCDPNFQFSIDGHTMNIIETDGISVTPYPVDQIQIFAGQRYSFVLTANQPISNYWVRANPNVGTVGFAGNINSAILRYNTAPVADPTSTFSVSNAMVETKLHPLENPGAPGTPGQGAADVNINLGIAFNGKFEVGGTVVTPPNAPTTVDASTFVPNITVPVLLQILSGAQPAQNLLPSGSLFTLPPNKVIEISIPGGSAGSPHPIHLHGHAFDVVRSAGNSTYNYDNPVRRDVVSIGANTDNVTIRFRTDNPGPWILHCHIDWHLDLGLAVVFAEDVAGIQSLPAPPPAFAALCPSS